MQTLKCCPQPNTDTITTVYSNKKQGVPRTISRSIITSGAQYLRLAGQACTRITELQNAIERVRMLARSAWNQMYRLLHFQCTGGSFAMWCWHLALLLSVSRTKSAPCLQQQMSKKATPWLLVVLTVYGHCRFSSSVSLGLAEASFQAWHFV